MERSKQSMRDHDDNWKLEWSREAALDEIEKEEPKDEEFIEAGDESYTNLHRSS